MKGNCFCGAVQFEVAGESAGMGYCHCVDCAAWAAAPINAFTLWPEGAVTVTRGADLIGTYAKTDNSHRKFCKACGGHLFTDHPGMKMVDVYASVLPDLKHEPRLHVFYGQGTVAVKDGLPKFADLPAEFGGSGDMLPE